MVDMAMISGAVSALKAAGDATKLIIATHDAGVMRQKAVELQTQILAAQESALAAQSEQFALLQRIRGLEEEVADLKAWNTEKKRYVLQELQPGVLAYALKEGMEPPEPPHKLCANCYNKGEKSILQTETRYPGRTEVLVCHQCGSDIYLSGGWQPEHSGRKRGSRG